MLFNLLLGGIFHTSMDFVQTYAKRGYEKQHFLRKQPNRKTTIERKGEYDE